MQRDIGEKLSNGGNGDTNISTQEPIELDALIIGGGFSGCYLIHGLRKAGFSCKIVEAGSALGGIWHWNQYPGARVDSQNPIYALSLPEVWKTWSWSEEYPGWKELQEYFRHVDKQLDISKDVFYNTKVMAADFDGEANKWTVSCNTGAKFRVSFLLAGIGFAAKRYIPDWKGLEDFQGNMYHSSFWPKEGVDVRGKRVAVVGTGATGVQIIQEWAKDAEHLTVFQRTPNQALPMRQAALTPEAQEIDKLKYEEYFKHRLTTDAGFMYSSIKDRKLSDLSDKDREAFFEDVWQAGGFRFLASYAEVSVDPKANRLAYDFWARKVRERVHDPRKQDLLAPLEPVHPFGARRPSLEQDYYDLFNRESVEIVDTKETPIQELTSEGILTEDGKLHKFDAIAMATGFDAVTGGLLDIKLRGLSGQLLSDKWSDGAWSYLGLTSGGYPNFFYTYGPQAPTAFSNGPSCAEPQGDWIVKTLSRMRERGLKRIDADESAEKEWKALVNKYSEMSLRHGVRGWWQGSNIPGKKAEPLNWAGGLPLYIKTINDCLHEDWTGFHVQ